MNPINVPIATAIINIAWWILSIGGGYVFGVDTNPWLDNTGEIALNMTIFGLSMFAAMMYYGVKNAPEISEEEYQEEFKSE